MIIEIQHIESKSEKHTYTFMLKGTYIIFHRFIIHSKEGKQRNWRVNKLWDNYNPRNSNIDEPKVPESVKREAITQVRSLLTVVTFNEWKSNGFKG
jgi:hypothetical protein